jgi:hypothetical protein
VKEKLAGGPWQASVDSWAKAIPEPYRVPMIELASELATVDKGVEGKEPEVIRHLTAALGVPPEKGREIFMASIDKM